MTWTTLTLQVTTPLFNGGADPDGSAGFRPDHEAGVRAASIRGAMRFWFRALAGTLTGPDLRLLAGLERRVFGGISAQRGEDGATPSPLVLRLPDPPRTSLDASFLRDWRSLGYLLGLGLMKPERGGARLLRPCVPPGGDPFELKVRFAHDRKASSEVQQAIEALAYASLWLACVYGGVGARIRRGFGGLRIVDAEGDLPHPWSPKWLQTPGLGLYERAEWLWPWPPAVFGVFQQYLQELINAERGISGEPDRWTEPPPFPVLSKKYSPAALAAKEGLHSWGEALNHGGEQLRRFRANRPREGRRRSQAPLRTAEWDDVINVITDDPAPFPLGALGLPVGYHDKLADHKFVVNAVIPRGREREELRRASPLWLRPVGAGNTWRLFTFAFRTRFLPDAVPVYLLPDPQAIRDGWPHDRELSVDQGDVEHLTAQWLNAMRGGHDFIDVIRD
jgi:hypothetical protein